MSLRGRLIVLLSAFALFTVVTGGAVIYGVQWHVQRAVAEFEESLGQTLYVERLRLALKEQANHLRDVIDGSTDALKPYFASRGQFLTKLAQLAMFNSAADGEVNWSVIENLAETLIAESDRCLALHQAASAEQARQWFSSRIEGELLPELDSRLLTAKTRLDEARNRATRVIGTTSSQMLLLTVIIAGTAFGLVVIGAVLIRRWLIVPLLKLREAAERFGRGEFDYRVALRSHDELGALGTAMNEMAQFVAEAQAGLQASETKHRLLFRNLRDAVVICDGDGRIVECHDSGTEILGVEGAQHLSRPLLEVWPAWRGAVDWDVVIAAAADRGRRFRAEEVELSGADDRPLFADLVIYPVEYGGSRYAAIIVRDVTERRRLQLKLRHAETMEAVGTLASGLAHDFNNLLAGVIGSLSLVANEMSDPHLAERLRAAVQTCWQAAALSRRLLNFAGSARGEPRVFALSEAVAVIVNALDPSFLKGINVQTDLDAPHFVRLDHDQFTQITLNLLRNAREAMPDGGTMRVRIETASRVDPNDDRTQRQYAVLVVGDTGCGMTPEAKRRIFEPFFTTKSRSSKRGRGMGMAIVHTAVRNAGGFIQIESAPDCGAVFRVHFPTCDPPVPSRALVVPAVRMQSRAAAILLVEEDAVWRDVARKALEAQGHTVVATPGGAETLPDMIDRYRGLDVVVLDVDGLVHADGLCEQLIAVNPGLRFVITTAGQEKKLPDGLRERSVIQLLKPFTLEALTSAVSNAQAPTETKN